MDLQASKKSKGLQEQQLRFHFNTLSPHSLTISINWIHSATRCFGTILPEWVSRTANDVPPGSSANWIENSGNGIKSSGLTRRTNRRRIRSICRGKDPIKGQNSQEPRFRYFSVPATSRAIAGNFLFAEYFHRLVFRERRFGALPLQIDIVPTFGARKNNSVGFTHNL